MTKIRLPSSVSNLLTRLRRYQKSHLLFLVGIFVVLCLNIRDLSAQLREIPKKREQIPFYFPGFKFGGLEDLLKDEQYLGYYTDKDLSIKLHAAQFAQAQYMLAPIILDLNNTSHPYILFDCTSEEVAFQKIQELKAIPLKKNQFGLILAKRTP